MGLLEDEMFNEECIGRYLDDKENWEHVHSTGATPSPNPDAYCRIIRKYKHATTGEFLYFGEDIFVSE